jgi:hypothetical protein
MIDAFAITTGTPGVDFNVLLFDASLSTQLGSVHVNAPNNQGGGALVSRPDKHAVPSTTCGLVPFDIMTDVQPPGGDIWTSDIGHFGIDLNTGLSCSCSQLPKVFEGQLITSTGLPWAVIEGGTRLQFALANPALRLSKNAYGVSSDIYYAIPYGASLFAGNAAYYSDGQPWAFLLDDGRLWPGSCYGLFSDNQTYSASYMVPATYASYAKGPPLFCVQ